MTSALLPAQIVFNNPLTPFGWLYFYVAGTTTPQAAYSDATGATPLANPLQLDANGQAVFWLKSGLTYKINLLDVNLTQQPYWPQDGIVADEGASVKASLASTSTGQGAALLFDTTGRNQHQKNADVLSAADYGVLPTNPDNTTAWAVAVAVAVANNKTLWVPNGTYVGTLGITTSKFNLVGESRDGCILKANNNSTPVISISGSPQNVRIKDLSVIVGAAGNNGTHWGISVNTAPYTFLTNLFVSGFNNNIHVMVNNEITLTGVLSVSAVAASTIAAVYPNSGTIQASLSGSVMNISNANGLTLIPGEVVTGPGIPGGTTILNLGTFNGTTGNVNLSASCTTESTETITVTGISYTIPTGCGLYVNGMGGGGAEVVIRDSHFWSSYYNVFMDTCQAPWLEGVEALLSGNTGLYFTVFNGAAGTGSMNCNGPMGNNIQSDSNADCGMYLQQQVNTSLSAVWVTCLAGTGTALVLSNSSFNSFQGLQAFGSGGVGFQGVHIAGGSHHNTFNGGAVMQMSGTGILIDSNCPNNIFNGLVINGNTPNYTFLDTGAGSPNMLVGCNIGSQGGCTVQAKDIVTSSNQMNGMTAALQFGQASMAANANGNMSAGVGQFNFVMPGGGSIVAISSSLSGTGVQAGTAAFYPLINGSAALTGSLSLQNNPGATATAASINLQAKGVHFNVGQTVGVSWQTITGTTAGLNAAVTLWLVMD